MVWRGRRKRFADLMLVAERKREGRANNEKFISGKK